MGKTHHIPTGTVQGRGVGVRAYRSGRGAAPSGKVLNTTQQRVARARARWESDSELRRDHEATMDALRSMDAKGYALWVRRMAEAPPVDDGSSHRGRITARMRRDYKRAAKLARRRPTLLDIL